MLALIALSSITACKKQENKNYLESVTAPVLTSSITTTPVLSVATKNDVAFVLNWTNPNYTFTTGVSSQDVTYTLQIDTTGANFSSPLKQEVSIAKLLTLSLTVGDFNGYLTKLGVSADTAHNIEMRIVANLNGAAPQYSNVIKFARVIPYEDFAIQPPPTVGGQLYITGNATASDWTNTPPATQKFTKVNNGLYTIRVALIGGNQYKFLSSPGNWQPQYGAASGTATSGVLAVNLGTGSDPNPINAPAASGTYTITVNFKLGTYSVQ